MCWISVMALGSPFGMTRVWSSPWVFSRRERQVVPGVMLSSGLWGAMAW